MQWNRKGMALMMVLGLMGIGAVLMVTVSTVLATYMRQVRAYQSTDRSIHYAQMGLDEVKWNVLKEYKQWLYESTHDTGANGPDYEPKVNSANYNDVPLNGGTLDTTGEYTYTAVATKGFTPLVATYPRFTYYATTYWVKVIDSVIQSDGKMYDPNTSASNTQIIGRVEGWMRIAEHAADALQFSHRYDIFCRGTEYSGALVTYDKVSGKLVKPEGVKEKHAHIRASAQTPDSMSISEYVVAVFDGFLNIGTGYNVYGKMHANEYVNFLSASNDFNEVCKIHNVLSTSQEFRFADGTPVANDGGKYVRKQTTINTYANTTASLKNVSPKTQRSNGFHFTSGGFNKAYAVFLGEIARPEIVPRITPKTADHFANVRAAARTNGMYLENGDARWVRFDPGDLTKNGDGKIYIKTLSGNLWVNGKKVLTGAGEYTVFINEQPSSTAEFLITPILYIDGNPSTATFSSTACSSETKFDINKGIYNTKGIRGISGVIDGQVSVYSGYDIVISGDITYQEFAKVIKFTYKNMNDAGKLVQPYLTSATPIKPDPNAPNLVGVNAMHDIILPGDLFVYAKTNPPYDGAKADRCDLQGNGIINGAGGAADGLSDIFIFGVYFAGHRAYGELPQANEHTYSRNASYNDKKGTWFIYGSLVSFEQVYAAETSSKIGFYARSYNYDPNLYTFKPPMTMQISTLPVWSWRITSGFPDGLALKK